MPPKKRGGAAVHHKPHGRCSPGGPVESNVRATLPLEHCFIAWGLSLGKAGTCFVSEHHRAFLAFRPAVLNPGCTPGVGVGGEEEFL